MEYSRINVSRTDTKRIAHPLQRKRLVALQDLRVCLDAHLPHVKVDVRCKDGQRGEILLLDLGWKKISSASKIRT